MLPVMVKEISDPMERHRGFSASGSTLNHKDLITGVADDSVLFLLDRADDVFQLDLTVAAELCFQDLIIDLGVTFKCVDQFSTADLVLPFGCDLAGKFAHGSLIRSRTLIIIIEKTAYRRTPVIDQRQSTGFFGKISDADVKNLRFLISLVAEIHSSEKRRIQHFPKTVLQLQLLLIGIDLMEQSLLVVKIFIAVLVHLRVVLPVILMHFINFFLAFQKGFVNGKDPLPYFFQNCVQINPAVSVIYHKNLQFVVIKG